MNLNIVLKAAIAKGASQVTRKPIAGLRRDVAELKRQVSELKRALRGLQKAGAAPAGAPAASEDAADEAAQARQRPSAKMVRTLRAKLGLTQAEFAKLADVSSLTVSKWETAEGRIQLRGRTLAGLARVRGLTKRTARAALEQA
jgi:DNA-binding transcriptional regulator YiaG